MSDCSTSLKWNFCTIIYEYCISKKRLYFMHIIDFGFAQYLSADDQNTSMRGSPLYMAPEILLKKKYDARVDLWSVGVIMYECLFGRAPYSSSNFRELAEKIKSQLPIQVYLFLNHKWIMYLNLYTVLGSFQECKLISGFCGDLMLILIVFLNDA